MPNSDIFPYKLAEIRTKKPVSGMAESLRSLLATNFANVTMQKVNSCQFVATIMLSRIVRCKTTAWVGLEEECHDVQLALARRIVTA